MGRTGGGRQYVRVAGAVRKWACALAWLGAAWGLAPAAAANDCDGPPQRLLQAVADPRSEAAAYWLDAATLRWPGQPPGRYRLLAAADGGLRLAPDAPAQGVQAAIALEPAPALAPEVAARFAFTGPGVELQVPAADRARLPALWRGQLLLVREDAQGRVQAATYLQWPGALDAAYAAADAPGVALGAQLGAAQTQLRLWAPTARAVALCLYPEARAPGAAPLPLAFDPATGTWQRTLAGDLRGRYYAYLVEVFVPGLGWVRNRVGDPYAISLSADGARGYLGDLDDPALAPPGWAQAARPPPPAANVDMQVYELHVRDFSAHDPGVAAARRGKYLAFADPGSAGRRHLAALARAGLSDVQLLPVFDFATVPERGCRTPALRASAPDDPRPQAVLAAQAARDCYNWGYDPLYFGAPEGSYASDPDDGAARVREFRAMVQALHALGLRVGMDVVYNHTHAAGQADGAVLDRIVPGYYQRLDAQGRVATSTCCANTATEHRMMARLLRDTLVRWARDYRIDSFRFDLMGHQPRAVMEAAQAAVGAAAGRRIAFIGEGWNFGEVADGARFVQAAQGRLDGTGIATFNDRLRDALRGGGCCGSGPALRDARGLLNGLATDGARRAQALQAADLARAGLAGSLRDYRLPLADGRVAPLAALDYHGQPAGYASAPEEVVNYVENHDNLTLWDLDALRLPADTPAAERARVQLLGVAFTVLAQGVPYFHAGIELLRSKSLDRNSYDSGDWFNRLDWSGRDNGFGRGLPPARDNGGDWPLLRPALRNPRARPAPRDIAWMRAAFRDWLRIRAETPLLRLREATAVQARLRFPNSDPGQDPRVIVGHLDGQGLPGPQREVLYLINLAPQAVTVPLPEEAAKPYALHPVQAAATAADPRPRQARIDRARGTFRVPGRTAVVYVVAADSDAGRR